MQNRTDEYLMSIVKKGNSAAINELVKRYQSKLLQYFFRMSGDRYLAEDLVQESFIRLYKYRTNFNEEKNFFAWFFQIAKNVWNTAFQKQQPKIFLKDWESETKSIEIIPDTSVSYDQQELIEKALLRLPESDRELVILYYLKGFSYSDMSTLLKMAEGTLRVKLCRALKKLGNILKRLGYEDK